MNQALTAGAVSQAPDLREAYRACTAFTREHARHFYYAFLILPRAKQQAIHAVYAFCQRADMTVDLAADPQEKRRRLAEFRAQLDSLEQSADPVLVALRDTLQRFPIRRELLYQLLDGMQMDLECHTYPDFSSLRNYCYHVASVVGLMSIEIFGYRDPRVRDFAETLGLAMQLTNVARDVREDAEEGRVYLPADELQRHSLSAEEIRQGKDSSEFRRFMRAFCERSDRLYDEALALLPGSERRNMRPALIMANLYRRILVEIRRRDYDVQAGKVRYPAWRKLLITARTLFA